MRWVMYLAQVTCRNCRNVNKSKLIFWRQLLQQKIYFTALWNRWLCASWKMV